MQPDLDKMRSLRQGLESFAKAGSLNSGWIKNHPLFFMAVGDADLYESSLTEHLIDSFKSLQTIDNFLTTLVEVDEKPSKHTKRFEDLLLNNEPFRRKFYTFFMRFLIASLHFDWQRNHSFNNYSSKNKKRDDVKELMSLVFSTKALGCIDDIMIEHWQVAEFVDRLIADGKSFHDYACEHVSAHEELTLNDETVATINIKGLCYDL